MTEDSQTISKVVEDFVSKLRSQEEEIRKKNKEIEAQRMEIEKKSAEVEQLEKNLQEKDSELKKFEQSLNAKRAELDEKAGELEVKMAELDEANRRLNERLSVLEKLETESQLAGIFAHEIAHVVARDAMNAMSNQIGIDILLSAVTSEDTPAGVTTAANLTNQIIGLRYSREDEQTADLAGLDYMSWTGYNPYAMVETIQMLQSQQESRPIEFLSTHPSPQSRLQYLTQKIQTQYPNVTTLKVGKQDYNTYVLQNLPPADSD